MDSPSGFRTEGAFQMRGEISSSNSTFNSVFPSSHLVSADISCSQCILNSDVNRGCVTNTNRVTFFIHRALLPDESYGGSGDSGNDQCLMVSRQRDPFICHISDIITWSCPLPHPGLPLPHGMHHLWHQLQCQPGSHQQHWTQVRVQISWIFIK